MKIALLAATAAVIMASPAAANQGNHGKAHGNNGKSAGAPYGQQPKVCLITYSRATNVGLSAEQVTKAQYLPLGIALMKDTAFSLIVTYGANGATGAGIDIARVSYNDPTVSGITTSSTTEQACNALEEYVDGRDNSDDDDDNNS
jgi:hypothetical protein